jgi:hypothetical protein
MFLPGAVQNTKLVTYHMRTGEIREYHLKGLENMKLKQATFMNGSEYLVVSATYGNIEQESGHTYDGYLAVYRTRDFSLVDMVTIDEGHLDDAVVDGNDIYLAYQADEPFGRVPKYTFENGKLRYVSYGRVSAFPHGVDIKGDLVAAACMKTCSVCIIHKNGFIPTEKEPLAHDV